VLKREGMTATLVTHDQLDAFAMADLIGVLGHGLPTVFVSGGPMEAGKMRPDSKGERDLHLADDMVTTDETCSSTSIDASITENPC
jgi:dihydroxyacid dehydratase/phosphogluconate dehydratase